MGQLSEELLVQRFGLFSYWKSSPLSVELQRPIRHSLDGLEQKQVDSDLLLLREPASIVRLEGVQPD